MRVPGSRSVWGNVNGEQFIYAVEGEGRGEEEEFANPKKNFTKKTKEKVFGPVGGSQDHKDNLKNQDVRTELGGQSEEMKKGWGVDLKKTRAGEWVFGTKKRLGKNL